MARAAAGLDSGVPAAASAALGVEFDPQDPASVLGKLGGMSRMIGATMQHTANPTGLKAGYKVNVIPQTATAEVDGRFLPGHEEEFFAEVDRMLGTGGQPRVHPSRHRARDHGGRGPVRRDVRVPAGGRPAGQGGALLLVRGNRREMVQSGSASGASGSARLSSRRNWIFPECSTVSTSGWR